jgi:hypothetical protein
VESATGTDAGSAAGAAAGAAAGTAAEGRAPDLRPRNGATSTEAKISGCRNGLSGNGSTSASAVTCTLVAETCLVFSFSLASLAIRAASFLAIVGAVSGYTSTISMPNELKICSRISTFNLVHLADHYTPLRTDPSPVDLEVQWAYRRFSCLAKAAKANPQWESALSIAITQSSLRGHQHKLS